MPNQSPIEILFEYIDTNKQKFTSKIYVDLLNLLAKVYEQNEEYEKNKNQSKIEKLYSIIENEYNTLPQNLKDWVGCNWRSLVERWADDMVESANSYMEDMLESAESST